jgi:IS30 family transposase
MTEAITTLPRQLFQTLTWDRGSEMADHRRFTVDTGVQVYFCDPYKPWQRGSNENTNGLLRQYLPKGSDFSAVTSGDLETIAASLNNRPRKTLNWLKPAEALAELLALTG